MTLKLLKVLWIEVREGGKPNLLTRDHSFLFECNVNVTDNYLNATNKIQTYITIAYSRYVVFIVKLWLN
jgi:hypothetical protein